MFTNKRLISLEKDNIILANQITNLREKNNQLLEKLNIVTDELFRINKWKGELSQDTELTVPDQKKLQSVKQLGIMEKVFKIMKYTVAVRALKAQKVRDLGFLEGAISSVLEIEGTINKADKVCVKREAADIKEKEKLNPKQ